MDIETMLAREAIRYTLALYNNAGDRGAIDDMMSCFAGDAVLQVGEDHSAGSGTIRAYYEIVRNTGLVAGPGARPTRHHLTTSRIEFDGADKANGWTYFLLVRDGQIIQHGIYVDRFRKEGERWLFTYRRVKVEFGAMPALAFA